MLPTERPALCVSIHDVAPATWPECLHLLHAIQAVANIPLSWLVVPCYHGSTRVSRPYERRLEQLAERGHELVLHGYTHRDDAPGPRSLQAWLLRTVYTQREGEFAALDLATAHRRLTLGLKWFSDRGWPVAGFVAPAWLMSRGTRAALAHFPFKYTTSYRRFICLRTASSVVAPTLVYAARNGCGRRLSPPVSALLARLHRAAPLVRLALHPRDAHHPALVRHAQGLVEQLLEHRLAMTKLDFSRRTDAPAEGRPAEHAFASRSAEVISSSNDASSKSARLPDDDGWDGRARRMPGGASVQADVRWNSWAGSDDRVNHLRDMLRRPMGSLQQRSHACLTSNR